MCCGEALLVGSWSTYVANVEIEIKIGLPNLQFLIYRVCKIGGENRQSAESREILSKDDNFPIFIYH